MCGLRPSLTQENLERTLKSFAKMVLKDKYINYENAKIVLNLDSLEEQKHTLSLKGPVSGFVEDIPLPTMGSRI